MKNILLVEPEFPTKTKSKNHKNFLPIGLLKLYSYYEKKNGDKVELVRGNTLPESFETPHQIDITTLFTYWSKEVWDTVEFFRSHYSKEKTEIWVGGIYASLHHDKKVFQKKLKKFDVKVYNGVHKQAEKCPPAYKQLMENGNSLDFQIVHSSRGCFRKCPFCGTWKIEPKFEGVKKITPLIEEGLNLGLRNLVFYDNNLFYNKRIKKVLNELIELKKQKKIGWCESKSGFDGRLLLKDPELAVLLKKAGFRYPRTAWDWGYDQWREVEKQINILKDAGYNSKDIYVFMIYDWKFDYNEMERKRKKCWKWKVQISDCRNRPLSQLHDRYSPMRDQSDVDDYHINKNWTDSEVKQFRKNVRRQNICVRHDFSYHSKILENRKHLTKTQFRKLKRKSIDDAKNLLDDLWTPTDYVRPKKKWSVEKLDYKKIKEKLRKQLLL